jgi:hypothetical protein
VRTVESVVRGAIAAESRVAGIAVESAVFRGNEASAVARGVAFVTGRESLVGREPGDGSVFVKAVESAGCGGSAAGGATGAVRSGAGREGVARCAAAGWDRFVGVSACCDWIGGGRDVGEGSLRAGRAWISVATEDGDGGASGCDDGSEVWAERSTVVKSAGGNDGVVSGARTAGGESGEPGWSFGAACVGGGAVDVGAPVTAPGEVGG